MKQLTPTIDTTTLQTLKKVGLRYVLDTQEGLFRKRAGKGFYYLFKNRRVQTTKTLKRIKSLVIPPAWQSVWICQFENGHLQATGRDARGRKQYRYHPEWSRIRNENKFESLLEFGKALPKIRQQIQKDLRRKNLDKQKVLAAVVSIMQETSIRIGNSAYANENGSYGLTTLLNKHVQIRGKKVRFQFRGKSGVEHDAELEDQKISEVIRTCQELPGEELFCYLDDHNIPRDITSTDVNEYLKDISGVALTAKDFRTWVGTVKAIEEIAQCGPLEKITAKALKQRQVDIIKKVSTQLRNTVAVCRKYYVHPIVFEQDEQLQICQLLKKASLEKKSSFLSPHEALLLSILEKAKK